ncbi:DUF3306 domain-containing protein [Diaphorobacter sp.]|uniref:DUF3306 domain-containing protein n=1 Tax=Diaphorobacter sp. TaxID=1934310 RepID=UPI003D098CF6
MAEGFLGRWSRRKQEARVAEPAAPVQAVLDSQPQPQAPVQQAVAQSAEPAAHADDTRPLPTLQDVQALTPASDFSSFVARGVAPEVRNAAMKKLFSDPHFNVMDGLDIYIDDYTQPTPLPLSTLRQLASAQAMGLVQDEGVAQRPGTALAGQGAGVSPLPAAAQGVDVAQSDVRNAIPDMQAPHDAPPQGAPQAAPVSPTPDAQDADMRLQPDHASGPQGTGNGPA